MFTDEDGKVLISVAKSTILNWFTRKPKNISPEIAKKFSEKLGVFVTLKIDGELRGCIGFVEPKFPLIDGIQRAALLAAFNDPRFPPLREEEFSRLNVEISVLTKPILLTVNKPEEYLDKIKIGRDGLIMEYSGYSGLLLPQVPVEEKWNVKEFLNYTCIKAGLPQDSWQNPECKVYVFQAEIFSE